MAARTVSVTKIGVGSFAKVVGVAAGAITADTTFVKTLGVSVLAFGWGVIIYPLILFVVGWIEGAIIAVVLNFVFKESKGLEIELDS